VTPLQLHSINLEVGPPKRLGLTFISFDKPFLALLLKAKRFLFCIGVVAHDHFIEFCGYIMAHLANVCIEPVVADTVPIESVHHEFIRSICADEPIPRVQVTVANTVVELVGRPSLFFWNFFRLPH